MKTTTINAILTATSTRAEWRAAYGFARKPDAIEKAIVRHHRKTWPQVASNMLATIDRETASAREAIYEAEEFVHSGLARLNSIIKSALPVAPCPRNAIPALPTGQKMPPNKCINPAFNIHGIDIA